MTKNIVEDLPTRKHPVAQGTDNKSGVEKPQDPEKKVKQAVYDIRYRARREDVPLRTAYSQYMSNSGLGGNERTIVKKKLFGDGPMKENFVSEVESNAREAVANTLVKIFVGEDLTTPKKYKVRVTDKSGKSYVRMADRAKITELRGNSNIESVEMTSYGEPYEGEKKKGTQTAKAKGGGLDPVGKEDGDVDNDGDKDSSDPYLMKRRKAIGKAMAKEEFIADAVEDEDGRKKLDIMKGKKNKIKILTKSKTGTYDEAVVSRFRSVLAEEDKVEDKKKEEKEVDPRGMKTAISLYKNKLRAMGMKMEHHQKDADGKVIEHDDEEKEIKEAAPLAAIPAVLAKGAAVVGKAAMAAGKAAAPVVKSAGKAVAQGTKAVGKAAGEGIKQGVKAGAATAGETVATAAGDIAANKLKQKAGMVAASNELEGDMVEVTDLNYGRSSSNSPAENEALARKAANESERRRNQKDNASRVRRSEMGAARRRANRNELRRQGKYKGPMEGFEGNQLDETPKVDDKLRKNANALKPGGLYKSGRTKEQMGDMAVRARRNLRNATDRNAADKSRFGSMTPAKETAERREKHNAARGVKTKGMSEGMATPESGTGKYYNEKKPTDMQLAKRKKMETVKSLTNQGKHKEASAMYKEDKYISGFRNKLKNIK